MCTATAPTVLAWGPSLTGEGVGLGVSGSCLVWMGCRCGVVGSMKRGSGLLHRCPGHFPLIQGQLEPPSPGQPSPGQTDVESGLNGSGPKESLQASPVSVLELMKPCQWRDPVCCIVQWGELVPEASSSSFPDLGTRSSSPSLPCLTWATWLPPCTSSVEATATRGASPLAPTSEGHQLHFQGLT